MPLIFLWAILVTCSSAWSGAAPFICADLAISPHRAKTPAETQQLTPPQRTAALVIFAHLAGTLEGPAALPSWTDDLFDPQHPGSVSHFYRTMSQGRLHLHGAVAPARYSGGRASQYLAADAVTPGQYGRFSLEILQQADLDIDFSRYDDDGPDGIPNSGDDDGAVDALFLVLPSVPANFLRGPATGISSLGLDAAFFTDDPAAAGGFIRIDPDRGTLQQGRTLAETAGIICHEYGHVLGLPDLFNTAFLRRDDDPGPEEDSAGIGRWGLMGWGALGWRGDDGPASLSAWSGLRLGWTQIEEPTAPREDLALEPVDRAGALYRIALGRGEYFLLEYRTRSNFYNRHIPAEGLLIWHVGLPRLRTGPSVDLVCADGRWLDGGFPAGTQAAPLDGGDNLDFWAHDQAYRTAWAGNLGDATDPFDGLTAMTFTSQTNPSAYNSDQSRAIQLENIRLQADLAQATLQVEPPALTLASVSLADANSDGLLTPGEEGQVRFRLVNKGGLTAYDIDIELTSDDPRLHIVQGLSHLTEAPLGSFTGKPTAGFPKVRAGQLDDGRPLSANLTVRSPHTAAVTFPITLAAAPNAFLQGRVFDPTGQGVDGIDIRITNDNRTYSLTSEDEGRFGRDLPPGLYFIQISLNPTSGLADYVTSVHIADRLDLTIELDSLVPFTGTVRTERGEPLEGVSIRSFFYSGSTDNQGNFRVELPSKTTAIQFEPTPAQQQQGLGPLRYDLDSETTGPLDIVLAPGLIQDFELVDLDGTPLGSAYVYFFSPTLNNDAQTNTMGRGAVTLRPEIYSLNITRGFGREIAQFFASPLKLPQDSPLRLTVPDLHSIEGRIEDISVEPFFAGGVRFTARNGLYSAQVDLAEDGSCRLALPRGDYEATFIARQAGASPSQRMDTLQVAGPGSYDFQVDAAPPISGQLTGPLPEGLQVRAISHRIGLAATSPVAADGSFALPLPPDRYYFFAADKQTNNFWNLGQADIPPNSDLRFSFPQGTRLEGRVRQEDPLLIFDSQPVPPLVMLVDQPLDLFNHVDPHDPAPGVLSLGPGHAGVLADAQGHYQLSAHPGSYTLIALASRGDGIGRVLTDLDLAGSRWLDIDLPAHPLTHRLYGTLSDSSRAPKGEWTLRLYDENTGVVVQQSEYFLGADSRGYLQGRGFNLEVPPGTYQVRLGLSDPVLGFFRQHDLGRVEIRADRRWDIELTAANTPIKDATGNRPAALQLGQNYPNPFNGSTVIPFVLPHPGSAELTVYNLLGQRVVRLTTGLLPAGPQTLHWNGRDRDGQPLATGLYIYRLQWGQQVLTRKLLILR